MPYCEITRYGSRIRARSRRGAMRRSGSLVRDDSGVSFSFECQTAKGDAIVRSRGAFRVRVLQERPPSKEEGAGKAGYRLIPMARVQQKKHAAVTTGSAGNTQPSLRNGFTAYTYSPRGPGLFAPVVRSVRHAGELDLSVGRPGRYDFAVRSSAVRPRDKSCASPSRPSHPASRFVTIAHTPLKSEAGRAHHTPDSTFR